MKKCMMNLIRFLTQKFIKTILKPYFNLFMHRESTYLEMYQAVLFIFWGAVLLNPTVYSLTLLYMSSGYFPLFSPVGEAIWGLVLLTVGGLAWFSAMKDLVVMRMIATALFVMLWILIAFLLGVYNSPSSSTVIFIYINLVFSLLDLMKNVLRIHRIKQGQYHDYD